MGYGEMEMKALRALSLGMMLLIVTFGPVFLMVPGTASAVEYSGTSPPFAPDTEWSLYVGWFAQGDIIEWYWATSDTLSFCLLYTVDSTTTQLWGFSYDDGYVVESAGHYGLWWYNNNLFFSATVDYWVAGFTPSTTITTPSEGTYLSTPTISVQGTTDPYSSGVLVGPDALHLREASWSGNDWGIDGYGLQEGQNIILVRTYYWLDYYGYENITYDRIIQVALDTVQPEVGITAPSNNTYLAGSLDLAWQCSDESGIALREVRLDLFDWNVVNINEYHAAISDGAHTIRVRITDFAGNSATDSITIVSDTVNPEVAIIAPAPDSKISKDTVLVTWTGSDALSGVGHYEVQITGGQWVDVGDATSYQFTNLDDAWYSVNVKAVDRSGNTATSTTGFGIYTSIWSQNGPYHGIPLYILGAVIVVAVFLAYVMIQRRTKPAEPPPEKSP